MKVLILTKKVPYPIIDGECLVIMNEIKILKSYGASIDVLSLNTKKHYSDISIIPKEIKQLAGFNGIVIDTKIVVWKAFLNLFSENSYNIHRFWSDEFNNCIKKLLSDNAYDVIVLQGLYLAQYSKTIRSHSQAKLIMRSHNVEFEIWERLAEESNSWAKKWYLKFLARRLKKYELEVLNDFDKTITITEKDLQNYIKMGLKSPGVSIPGCIEGSDTQGMDFIEESIFFIGSFDWAPNVNGLNWFLEEVWTRVLIKFPTWKLYIAGRNYKKENIKEAFESVNCIGEVENAQDFMRSKNIMIVPLFSGSGMRIKIIEAMMCGKPIVSSSIGAEGLDYIAGKNILIADTAEDFYDELVFLIENQERSRKIGQEARENAISSYSCEKVGEKLKLNILE